MIRRWLALTYYLYALRLAALSHFYFNRLYFHIICALCGAIFELRSNLRFCKVFRLPESRIW
nr:hypothetical protein [uncultured Kingella sp.]